MYKHARVIRRTPQPDGTVKIEKESYFEKLNSYEEEISQNIKTSKANLLHDLLDCVSVITNGTSKQVVITIKADEQNEPMLITKQWVVKKENYK